MNESSISDLAICVADDPKPSALATHLFNVTFASLKPIAVTFYMRVESTEGEGLILVGHHGLSSEEEANYTFIQLDFPLPAAEAITHALPFSYTLDELAERFPLLRIRSECADSTCQIAIPITIQGITVGVINVTSSESFSWKPASWHTAIAIQSLLSLYVRTTDRVWSPLRPLNSEFAARQGLSERQVGVLQLVDQGRPTSAIAARMGFSESTIKQDLRRAMIILQVNDRQRAVARARELGLIPGV